MGWMDKINLKKILEEDETEENDGFELIEKDEPEKYKIFDRLKVDFPALIEPESATWEETYFKIGDAYTRTFYIHTYPQEVGDNWLRTILRFPYAIDVSIYIHPIPVKPFLTMMRRRAANDEAAVNKEIEDGVIEDSARKSQLQDTLMFIKAIEEEATKPFQVMCAFTLRADSKSELDHISKELDSRLNQITTRQVRHRHKQGFLSTLPTMNNRLMEKRSKVFRPLHTQGLMSMFPFTSTELTHETGVMIGVHQETGTPIILNRFMQPTIPAPNTAILGSTGSGKSYFAKLEMARWAYRGVPIMVLDPSGEYREVCQGLGGANIDISLDSNQIINPLDFSTAVRPGHNALREKIAFMVDFLRLMVRTSGDESVNIDAMTATLFENALIETYRLYGYSVSELDSQQGATPENMPILSDVWRVLSRIAKTDRDREVQRRVKPLLASLNSFVGEGRLAPLFDQRTTVNLSSHFLNFDYSKLNSSYLSLGMFLVMGHIRTTFFTQEQQVSGEHRLLYLDEVHELTKLRDTYVVLEETMRVSRKYGVGLTVMTQNVGVFINKEKESEGILSNCPIRVLLKQEPNEADVIREKFKLTSREQSKLMSARPGEGLVYVGGESAWFSAVNMASPLENELMTTTMSERAEIEQRRSESIPTTTQAMEIEQRKLTYQPEISAPAAPTSEPFAPTSIHQPPSLPPGGNQVQQQVTEQQIPPEMPVMPSIAQQPEDPAKPFVDPATEHHPERHPEQTLSGEMLSNNHIDQQPNPSPPPPPPPLDYPMPPPAPEVAEADIDESDFSDDPF
jgi:hypothetical protein